MSLPKHIDCQFVGQYEAVTDLRPIVDWRISNLVESIFYSRRETDRAVARNRPRGRGPDHDRSAYNWRQVWPPRKAGSHRKLHPNRIADIILVFDLSFGERGLLHHRPHHRLTAAIKRGVGGELHQLARYLRLGESIHRGVGMRPIPGDAEPDEFGALHLDPVRGEGPAFAAEFDQGRGIGKIRLLLALGAVVL